MNPTQQYKTDLTIWNRRNHMGTDATILKPTQPYEHRRYHMEQT